ncbi:MAG TPA: CotH kinase family protein [Verrucomicrobiae bacterium]|jgi:hypothetical protein
MWAARLAVAGLFPVLALGRAHASEPIRTGRAGDDLFTNVLVARLRLEIPPEGMAVLQSYEWNRNLNGQDRTNVLATVREGNRVYTNVAVHLKGGLGSFRPVDDKPALTLSFDRFAEGQRFHGLQKIYLNNSVQDPSYLSEKICREMFLAAGIPSPRAGHARVQLNERDLGLYVLVEGWNKQFLKQHFKDARGNLYDGGYGNEVTNHLELNSGDFPQDESQLQALGRAAQERDLSQRLARMGEVLDLDRFLTFVAMEIMLAHWDGYTMNKNNFRVFHDKSSDRLMFLPHGMDQMFGVFRSTPATTITPHMKGLVARSMVEVPEGRRRYLERMSQLLTNVFKVPALTNRVQHLAAQLGPALADNPVTLVNFSFGVERLVNRMAQRATSVAQQLQEASKPLAFDASDQAKLTEWRPQRDSGSPSFTSNSGGRNGSKALEIRASGARTYGSWRTTVLLDKGEYQFVGRVQTEDLAIGPDVTRGGVTLRMSGEREAKMVEAADAWTTLTYDFTMPALADVELLCEFRGNKGRARFDADSLKLIRKSKTTKPAASQNTKAAP